MRDIKTFEAGVIYKNDFIKISSDGQKCFLYILKLHGLIEELNTHSSFKNIICHCELESELYLKTGIIIVSFVEGSHYHGNFKSCHKFYTKDELTEKELNFRNKKVYMSNIGIDFFPNIVNSSALYLGNNKIKEIPDGFRFSEESRIIIVNNPLEKIPKRLIKYIGKSNPKIIIDNYRIRDVRLNSMNSDIYDLKKEFD